MTYTLNWSEEYVDNMYRKIGIHQPHQLYLEEIAARNKASIIYHPRESMRIENVIILDSRLSDAQKWQEFGHELSHVLWSLGNQITLPMPIQVYQENKSNNFAQYACIPTFMLRNLKIPAYEIEAIGLIMETFGVEREFAEKRLKQYIRNLTYR